MTYNPVSGAAIQYEKDNGQVADGYYLKFYIADTTTPLSMATDSTAATLLVKCKLNDKGYPITNPLDNDTVFIPYVDQAYRYVLYQTEADADANNTAAADVNIANVQPLAGANSKVESIDSVADLAGLVGSVDGQQVHRAGWIPGNNALANPMPSAGVEVWDAAGDRTTHTGGTIKSPTVPAPTDFTSPTQIDDYLNGVGETAAATPGVWRLLYTTINMAQFGLRDSATIDQTSPIQATINSLPAGGGKIDVPYGQFLTTSEITGVTGMQLIGEGEWGYQTLTREATTSFLAKHTGASILSLKGCHSCVIQGLGLEGDATVTPKTGLLLGRSAADSAGWHKIARLGVWGYFTVACIYSIASEDNYWQDITCWLFGGGALYNLVSSPEDVFSVDSLVSSSNLTNTFIKFSAFNSSTSGSSACIYLETGLAMGSFSFFGGYLIPHSGNYVHINNGALDGLAPLGPFVFHGMGGEILAPVAPYLSTPDRGFYLTGAVPVNLPGLTISGNRFQLINAAGTREIITQEPNVTLISPNIVIPPVEDPTIGFTLLRQQIDGGIIDVGDSSAWIPATLQGLWADVFGAPFAAASYSIDPVGRVSFRGTVAGGAGVIFTLPVDYRPKFDMYFVTNDGAGGVTGRVQLVAATGAVTMVAGTGTQLDLTSIQFKL